MNGAWPPLPWHVVGGASADRRLLLLTYHFPPSRAVGALRWRKFLAHLPPTLGTVDVLARDPRELPDHDATGLADLPAGLRIFAIPTPVLARDRVTEIVSRVLARARRARVAPAPGGNGGGAVPGSLHRAELPRHALSPADWRRRYHADAERARERGWSARAVACAARLRTDGAPYGAVISSGPPHMVHEAGARLADQWHVPFVMDLRDPWSLVERLPEWHASPWWYAEARRAEARAVRRADLIITTTGPAAEALARRHPAVRGRIRAIPNGVDDDPLPVVERPDRFIIAYAGTIYLDRDPRPLFHGAARFLAQHHLSPSTCTIEFMGEVRSYNGTSLTALARETGVAEHLRLHPPQPRAEALRFLAGASVLVCLPQDSTLAIPAKLFEYLRFPAAVLALATQDSATGQLLGPSAADVVAPDDPDGIAAALARHYAVWASGRRPAPLADGLGVSRRALARDLFATVATLTKD